MDTLRVSSLELFTENSSETDILLIGVSDMIHTDKD